MKYIFLDVDGTIIDHFKKEIPLKTIETIKELRKNNRLFIASGRAKDATKIGLDVEFDGLIASLGADIYYKDEEIYDKSFTEAEIIKIKDLASKYQIGISFECRHKGFGSEILLNRVYGRKANTKLFQSKEKYWYRFDEYTDEKVYKFMAETTIENKIAYDLFLKEIKSFCEILDYKDRNEPVGEVSPLGVSKGFGIQKLSDLGLIDLKNTIVIGDSINDVSMFKVAAVSFAMGQAPAEVKKHAAYVTDSVSDNGFYKAFKNIGLVA